MDRGGPGERSADARLSVVVPTLNEEASLPRLLERLRAGLGDDDRADEVVVADGGSQDATVDLAREAGARVVVGPRGRGRQLADGARTASGALLLFLHADCVPAPGALAAVRAALRDPEVAAVGMRQRIEARGALFRAIERAADLRVRMGLVYGDSALGVARASYDAAGGFRPLPLFEDVDLSRRLRARGRVRLVPAASVRVSPRRWEREGVLRATARNWMLTVAWMLGVAPERLARHYRPHETGSAP